MRESNPEKKSPSPLETKPQERKDPARALGEAAMKGAQRKK